MTSQKLAEEKNEMRLEKEEGEELVAKSIVRRNRRILRRIRELAES